MQVYALVDREGDRNITRQVILTDQFRPNGVEWRNGSLYVAEAGRITRYDHVDDYALAGKVRELVLLPPHPWAPNLMALYSLPLSAPLSLPIPFLLTCGPDCPTELFYLPAGVLCLYPAYQQPEAVSTIHLGT